MSLATGTRLGPYEIMNAIGAGGMGEVYRAKDTRLDRTVALKILSPTIADDPQFRDRFEREARVISSLDHPHICAIHDVGEATGPVSPAPSPQRPATSPQAPAPIRYLVMQYLEGDTLAERLKKGPLPVDHMLRHAIEIADALDAAHRKGIVHRDLKPGNIMITRSGGAKLLDFGLAKTTAPSNVGRDFSRAEAVAPTMNSPMTAAGTIMGTVQYMAPEQLEGREADTRSDIFALGAVIYEMATGKKAFEGESQASLIAAILDRDPPPMATLQPLTPRLLERVVRQSLAKAPDERWQSARDVLTQLKWIAEGASEVEVGRATSVASTTRELLMRTAFLFAGAVVTGAAVWIVSSARARPVTSIFRAAIPTPAGVSVEPADQRSPIAIAPDGARIAFVAVKGGTSQLFVRALDESEAKPIPGTEGANGPFFSPDGHWIGFVVPGALKKVSLGGGAPQTIVTATNVRGASWGDDDRIVYPPTFTVGLSRVAAGGGTPEVLTSPKSADNEKSHRFPEVLPGGKAILFTIGPTDVTSFDDARIAVLSLATKQWKVVIRGGTHARYAPSGHIVYARAGSLFAVPFDVDKLEVTGPSVSVVDDVSMAPDFGTAAFAISPTGTLAYVPGGQIRRNARLMLVDRAGRSQLMAGTPTYVNSLRVSPDGARVAVVIGGANDQAWLYDVDRKTTTRLMFRPGDVRNPAWTPDGTHVTFGTTQPYGVVQIAADGSGSEEILFPAENDTPSGSWSPDGERFAFAEVDPQSGADIWVYSVKTRKREPFARSRFSESSPEFSPDGRWVAYVSDESGRPEVYVRAFPGPAGRWSVSTDGGTSPVWSPKGRELFFRSGTKVMAVQFDVVGSAFKAVAPHALFDGPFGGPYHVMPDGSHFVMIQNEPLKLPAQINLILNWFVDLRRRVPGK